MKKLFTALVALVLSLSVSAQFYIYCSNGSVLKVDSIGVLAPEVTFTLLEQSVELNQYQYKDIYYDFTSKFDIGLDQITWTSSDESVAIVSSNGQIHALAEGKATITAIVYYLGGETAQATLEVVVKAFQPGDHIYVDLGLPSGLKWATCNVGANIPEEYGDYFAWGEVAPKEYYDWSRYKYGLDADQLTKYCNSSDYGKDGFIDDKTVLELKDDAATANWGGAWRMPTTAEQRELINNCTWDWTTQNGVNGYKVTGPNGNSIFLPAAGYMDEGTLYNAGSYGVYWSSSLRTVDPGSAYNVFFDSGDVDWRGSNRYYGLTVRPVCQ